MQISLIAVGGTRKSGVRFGSLRNVLLVLCAISAFAFSNHGTGDAEERIGAVWWTGPCLHQSNGVLTAGSFFRAGELLYRGS